MLDFWENIKNWYFSQTGRDKFALKILGYSVIIIFYYSLVWQPINEFKSENINKFKRNKYYENWLEANKEGLDKIYSSSLKGDDSLLNKIDKVNKKNNIKFDNFSNEIESQISLSFYKVEFNKLLSWIKDVEEKSNLQISQINIVKNREPGLVNCSLTVTDQSKSL